QFVIREIRQFAARLYKGKPCVRQPHFYARFRAAHIQIRRTVSRPELKIAEHLRDAGFCCGQAVECQSEVRIGLRQFATNEFDVLKGSEERLRTGELL